LRNRSPRDDIDSHKIASLIRGGLLPQSYVYPATMRSTRDVLQSRDGQNDTFAGTILAANMNIRVTFKDGVFEPFEDAM